MYRLTAYNPSFGTSIPGFGHSRPLFLGRVGSMRSERPGMRRKAAASKSGCVSPIPVRLTVMYCKPVDNGGWQAPTVLLAVDLVILTLRDSTLQLLLVERGVEPYLGAMALPGGFLRSVDEDILTAAH